MESIDISEVQILHQVLNQMMMIYLKNIKMKVHKYFGMNNNL